MLTKRTLRPDFHAWWTGWLALLGVIALVALFVRAYEANERKFAAALRAEEAAEAAKLKAKAAYLAAGDVAARRRHADYVATVQPGEMMPWLDVVSRSPVTQWQGWTTAVEPAGVKYRMWWIGHRGARGYKDGVGGDTVDWEEALRGTRTNQQTVVQMRIENLDTQALTVKVWWFD